MGLCLNSAYESFAQPSTKLNYPRVNLLVATKGFGFGKIITTNLKTEIA